MEKYYIQITSGRGPVECCRVVVLVMKKLVEHSKQLGLEVELVEHEDGSEDGCMFSATLSVQLCCMIPIFIMLLLEIAWCSSAGFHAG